MDTDKAKELLAYHSCHHSNIHHPKWGNGFMGQLRPYRGFLREENFLELVEVLQSLKPLFQSDVIDRRLMFMAFDICTLPRTWGFDMPRRDNLISKEDMMKLDDWLFRLSVGVSWLLGGAHGEEENMLNGYGISTG